MADEYNPAKDAHDSFYAAIEAKRLRGDTHDWENRPWKRREVIGDCTLYLGDCLEILPALGKVDAVVTDPPYGVTRNAWDVAPDLQRMWSALYSICSGPIVVSARQPFAARLLMSNESDFRHEWIWTKNKASGHLNAKNAPLLAHETVLVFSVGATRFTPQMTTGHKPANAAVRRVYSPNYGAQKPTEYGGATERYPQTVLAIPVLNNDAEDRFHPTQKPVDLGSYFVRSYSSDGDLIADPYMGSGTTGVACVKLGRKFIGIEIDEGYFDIACRRIADAVARPDLFISTTKASEPVQQPLFGGEAA